MTFVGNYSQAALIQDEFACPNFSLSLTHSLIVYSYSDHNSEKLFISISQILITQSPSLQDLACPFPFIISTRVRKSSRETHKVQGLYIWPIPLSSQPFK